MDSIKSKASALAVAAVLALAAFAAPAAFAQEAAQEAAQEDISFEECFTLAVFFVQEEVQAITEDAIDDDDVEDTLDDLVQDVADNEDIEDEILDELTPMVPTNQTNVTMQGETPDLSGSQLEDVAAEIVNEAIVNEVLEVNMSVADAVSAVVTEAFVEALTDPEAELEEIAQGLQDDVADAVEDSLSEDDVVAAIENLTDEDIGQAIDDDEIDIAAAVQASGVEAGEQEVPGANGDAQQLQDQIDQLNDQISRLQQSVDALIDRLETLESNVQTGESLPENQTATNSTQ